MVLVMVVVLWWWWAIIPGICASGEKEVDGKEQYYRCVGFGSHLLNNVVFTL